MGRTIPSGMGLLLAVFFFELLTECASLIRRHFLPLFTHFLPTFRRESPEPLTRVTNGLPLFGRQLAEALETLAELLPLIRRQLLPLLKPLLCLLALFLVHVGPLAGSVQQTLLPIRRKFIPAVTEPLKDLLILLVQLLPGNRLAIRLRPGDAHHR